MESLAAMFQRLMAVPPSDASMALAGGGGLSSAMSGGVGTPGHHAALLYQLNQQSPDLYRAMLADPHPDTQRAALEQAGLLVPGLPQGQPAPMGVMARGLDRMTGGQGPRPTDPAWRHVPDPTRHRR